MTVGLALLLIVAGLLIAALLEPTIGMIVAVIGLVGLVLAVATGARGRARI